MMLYQETDVNTPQGALTQLYGNIREIKSKAVIAETAIRTISDDPAKAEYTKSRLMNATSMKTQLILLSDLFADLEIEVSFA